MGSPRPSRNSTSYHEPRLLDRSLSLSCFHMQCKDWSNGYHGINCRTLEFSWVADMGVEANPRPRYGALEDLPKVRTVPASGRLDLLIDDFYKGLKYGLDF